MTMDCNECVEQLYGFLDGELTPDATESVQQHLDDCTKCFRRSQFEEAFRRTIRAVAARRAPVGLEQRVRATLDEEDARRTGRDEQPDPARPAWTERRRTWVSRALAAAALLVLGVAVADLVRPRGFLDRLEPVEAASVRGELVCLDCLIAGRPAQRSALAAHLPPQRLPSDDVAEHHAIQLRGEEGRMWTLLAEDAAEPVLDHSNVGQAATLVGTLYPELGAIRVARATLH